MPEICPLYLLITLNTVAATMVIVAVAVSLRVYHGLRDYDALDPKP